MKVAGIVFVLFVAIVSVGQDAAKSTVYRNDSLRLTFTAPENWNLTEQAPTSQDAPKSLFRAISKGGQVISAVAQNATGSPQIYSAWSEDFIPALQKNLNQTAEPTGESGHLEHIG